jgi:hypothetical protein
MSDTARYTGTKMSIDFRDGDLVDVFKLFAEVSGLNIVVNPGIAGRVTCKMQHVPWDQLLDLVLRANGLGYLLEGNVLRIGRITDFIHEEAQRQDLARVRSGLPRLHGAPAPAVVQHIGEVNVMQQNVTGSAEQLVQAQNLQGSPVNRLNAGRITESFKLVGSADAPEDLKTALLELHTLVGQLVQGLPAEQSEAAETTANLLETFSRQALEKKPVKEVLLASGKALLELAKGVNASVQLPASLAKIAALLGLSNLF